MYYRVCINRATLTLKRRRVWASMPLQSLYVAQEIAKHYATVTPIPGVVEVWELWDALDTGIVFTTYPGRI